jgi:hypothetical protein
MSPGLVVGGMMGKVGWGYWLESKKEVTDAALDCDVSQGLKKQVSEVECYRLIS